MHTVTPYRTSWTNLRVVMATLFLPKLHNYYVGFWKEQMGVYREYIYIYIYIIILLKFYLKEKHDMILENVS